MTSSNVAGGGGTPPTEHDLWFSFATLILDRSNQHIQALDSRINYVVATVTAMLLLLGGGLIALMNSPLVESLVLVMIPMIPAGVSLGFGISALRRKRAGKLAVDKTRPSGMHMYSSDIIYRTRAQYVDSLLQVSDSSARIEVAQNIYDLQLLIRDKHSSFDNALMWFRVSLVSCGACLLMLVFLWILLARQ